MTQKKAKFDYMKHRRDKGLVLTCVSNSPSPPATCGTIHGSEKAASNHAALLERRRMKGQNAEGLMRKRGEPRRGVWRSQWCSPAFLGMAPVAKEDGNAEREGSEDV